MLFFFFKWRNRKVQRDGVSVLADLCKCYISQIKYCEGNKEDIIWIRVVNFIQNCVKCWACIRLPYSLGSCFIICSSCSFSPMFGKHQLSQRSESLFPQPASLSPCRVPGAVKYRTYCIAFAHLAALSRVPAGQRWHRLSRAFRQQLKAACPGSLGTLGSVLEAATCTLSASSPPGYAAVCVWWKSIWEKGFSNKIGQWEGLILTNIPVVSVLFGLL